MIAPLREVFKRIKANNRKTYPIFNILFLIPYNPRGPANTIRNDTPFWVNPGTTKRKSIPINIVHTASTREIIVQFTFVYTLLT